MWSVRGQCGGRSAHSLPDPRQLTAPPPWVPRAMETGYCRQRAAGYRADTDASAPGSGRRLYMTALLSGKVALVTGVSRDQQIGQAVARALAAEGAALGIVARSRDHVEARAQELAASGARVLPVAANLADESEVREAVDRVVLKHGRIDILVNLAGGLTRYKPAVEHTLEDWNSEMNNNLLAAFLCARAVFPRLRDAGGGTIINFARAGSPQANMV